MEPTWNNQLAEARKLPTSELRRHAAVSKENRHRCKDCFCCAAWTVIEERARAQKHSRQMGGDSMKTTIDPYAHLLPAPEVLYRLASDRLRRQKALEGAPVSESMSPAFSEHLNAIAIKYLIANGGR